MRNETWLADRVQVTVSGCFTTHHLLQTANGVLGELTLPAFKRRGLFRAVSGQELVVERTSWWPGTHELREDGVVLGTAAPQSLWRGTMRVGYGGLVYLLEAIDVWCRRWHLVDEAGIEFLEIQPRGIFGRGATLRILQPVDIGLLVFAYHLVNAGLKERTVAASAGASAVAGS